MANENVNIKQNPFMGTQIYIHFATFQNKTSFIIISMPNFADSNDMLIVINLPLVDGERNGNISVTGMFGNNPLHYVQ